MCEDPYHASCHSKLSWAIFGFWISCIFFIFVFFGCTTSQTVAPVWEIPADPVSEEVNEGYQSKLFQPGDWPEKRWWEQFNDSQLSNLIDLGLSSNPLINVAEAEARIAFAQATIAKSALLPLFNFDSDVTKYQVSKTGIFGAVPPGSFPFNYTQSEMYFSLKWEIDWWGKHRDALKAILGEYNARLIEAEAAKITLSLNIARAYFFYQAAALRNIIAEDLVRNRESYLTLIQERSNRNLASEVDLQTAYKELASAKEYSLYLEQDMHLLGNSLRALLAGNFNEEIIPLNLYHNETAINLPESLPLDLISHRTEIMAQLWRIDSAGQNISVAKKEFLPNLNLLGLGGLQTIDIRKWLDSDSKYGNIGPAVHLPIFQGGALIANVRAKQAIYSEAVSEYEHLLINAVQEVLDSITNVKFWNQRLTEKKHVVHSQEINTKLIKLRAEHHLNSDLDTLAAEKNLFNDKDSYIQTLAAALLARLQMIKALGGGFQNGE